MDTNIITITKEIIAQEEAINTLGSITAKATKLIYKLNRRTAVYGLCIITLACIGMAQNTRITNLEKKVNNTKG